MRGKRACSTGTNADDFKVECPAPRKFGLNRNVAGCSSAWQSACFGNKRPQVQILSPRLTKNPASKDAGFFISR